MYVKCDEEEISDYVCAETANDSLFYNAALSEKM